MMIHVEGASGSSTLRSGWYFFAKRLYLGEFSPVMGWSGGMIQMGHGEDMDLWIAVNCPGLRIPEFLRWGLGWSGYVLIVK